MDTRRVENQRSRFEIRESKQLEMKQLRHMTGYSSEIVDKEEHDTRTNVALLEDLKPT